MNTLLQDKIALLPEKPGVYKMLDASGTVIYVGKAKVLAMVSHIADFEDRLPKPLLRGRDPDRLLPQAG